MKEYALYKGEELLSMGTANEIAIEMGIKKETVYFYKSNYYKNRTKDKGLVQNRRILVDIS